MESRVLHLLNALRNSVGSRGPLRAPCGVQGRSTLEMKRFGALYRPEMALKCALKVQFFGEQY